MARSMMMCADCQKLLQVGEMFTIGSNGPCWACWEPKPCGGPLTSEQRAQLGAVHVVTKWNRRGARSGHGFDRIIVTVPMPEEELEHLKCRLLPGGKLEFTYANKSPGHARDARKE